jgi:hypothetical protein
MNASKLNVGGTPIINGTVGRILFQGASDTLGESANLFWDNTNGRLGIGTSSPASRLHIGTTVGSLATGLTFGSGVSGIWMLDNTTMGIKINSVDKFWFRATDFYPDASLAIDLGLPSRRWRTLNTQQITDNGSNVLINTTTDAGYKLDVNGTARVVGATTNGALSLSTSFFNGTFTIGNITSGYVETLFSGTSAQGSVSHTLKNNSNFQVNYALYNSAEGGSFFGTARANSLGITNNNASRFFIGNVNNADILIGTNNLERMRVFGGGNIAIGTTTDAGYKLDVNGTARVQGNAQISSIYLGTSNNVRLGDLSGVMDLNAYSGFSLKTWAAGWGSGTTALTIASGGNVLINTTTDAGFKLDVNGTARVTSSVQIGTQAQIQTFGGEAIYGTVGSIGTIYLQGSLVKIGNVTNTTISGNALGASLYNVLLSGNHTSSSSGTQSDITINPTLNFTSGTYVYRGIYYNPTITSLTGTTHHAFHSTSGRIRFEGLPTSPAGLSAGDLYNNLGVLMIV